MSADDRAGHTKAEHAACAAFLIGGWFVEAACLRVLWGWFIAPLGLPELGYWQTWGVAMTLTAFVYPYGLVRAGGTMADSWAKVGAQWLGPPFALLVGWAIKSWCM